MNPTGIQPAHSPDWQDGDSSRLTQLIQTNGFHLPREECLDDAKPVAELKSSLQLALSGMRSAMVTKSGCGVTMHGL